MRLVLVSAAASGKICIRLMLRTVDVIMTYCFGRSYRRLEEPDFDAVGHDAGHGAASLGWVMKHNFWILWIVQHLPQFVVRRLGIALAAFVDLNAVRRRCRNELWEGLILRCRNSEGRFVWRRARKADRICLIQRFSMSC